MGPPINYYAYLYTIHRGAFMDIGLDPYEGLLTSDSWKPIKYSLYVFCCKTFPLRHRDLAGKFIEEIVNLDEN